ncbi:hypothetical protein KTI03_04355 [Acinetobacter pittii]|uniref:hypothetical protein n=1 Tax=Acinetobacter pittii TaxID=48296 RepID=UPI0021D2BF00|nr:hypothetical protein [Acinetobacter pittii]MCU4462939.1 hypothetical protein [Acinetobacter pittii]
MAETVYVINLTIDSTLRICDRIQDLINAGENEIEINFTSISTVEPFGFVYFSNFIKTLRDSYPRLVLKEKILSSVSTAQYAGFMGFFKCCGFDHGSEARTTLPNDNSKRYIPITKMNVADIKRIAADRFMHVGDLIEENSRLLAELITGEEDTELVETLTYCYREIIRNVVEHSESETITFCAQYWPSKNKTEVVVLDEGVGIKNSLEQNTSLPTLLDDREAVSYALLPSISSKVNLRGGKKKRRQSDDQWQNTGFGLYMTHRIAGMGGEFFIGSGTAGILIQNENKLNRTINLDGTVLRMVIKTDAIEELRDILGRFREEGFKLARTYTDIQIEPSKASMMLFSSKKQDVE